MGFICSNYKARYEPPFKGEVPEGEVEVDVSIDVLVIKTPTQNIVISREVAMEIASQIDSRMV